MFEVGEEYAYALWFQGSEQKEKAEAGIVRCFTKDEEAHDLIFGPIEFEVLPPYDLRLSGSPPPEDGTECLVGYAKCVAKMPPKAPDMGFITSLSPKDLELLRNITRIEYTKTNPGQTLTDEQVDQVIAIMGPEVAYKLVANGTKRNS